MRDDVAFADCDRFGQLADTGLHGRTLVCERLLTLTLGGDTQARLGKLCRCGCLGVTQERNPGAGCRSLFACCVELE